MCCIQWRAKVFGRMVFPIFPPKAESLEEKRFEEKLKKSSCRKLFHAAIVLNRIDSLFKPEKIEDISEYINK